MKIASPMSSKPPIIRQAGMPGGSVGFGSFDHSSHASGDLYGFSVMGITTVGHF